MLKSTFALSLALFTLPALAQAGALIETRHGAEGVRCVGDGGKKGAKKMEKWGTALGGEDTRKAWKELIGAGKPGCDAIATWLAAGAEGEEANGIADVVDVLIQNGEPHHIEAALSLWNYPEESVARRILIGLEYRLAVVDEATAKAIATDDRPKVALDALSVFIGYHSVGQMKTVYGVPVYEEIAYWGPNTAPPAYYVDAVRTIFASAGEAEKEAIAKFAGRHFREGHAGQEVWVEFLLPMVTPASEEDLKSANVSALSLAWGEPEGIDDAVTAVLGGGNEEVLEHLVDGFEKRLAEGRGTRATIGRLETIAAAGTTDEYKRAAKIAKKYGKKVQ